MSDYRIYRSWSVAAACIRCESDATGIAEVERRSTCLRIEKNDRSIRLSWMPEILRLGGEPHQRAIFDALFGPLGHKIAIQRTLTPAEELREMRAFMAQNSPLALHEFDKEIGR